MSRDNDPVGCACPSGDDLAAFVAGRLPVGRATLISAHVADCGRCETTVALLQRRSETALEVTVAAPREGVGSAPADSRWALPHATAGLPRREVDEREAHEASTEDATRSIDTARSPDAHETESYADPGLEDANQAALQLPERIGPYFVLRILGRGGYGIVYLAKDPADGSLVAIKVPRPEKRAGEEAVRSFLHEARTVAELVHPGIVQVKDWGRTEQDDCFVVMHYVEGRSLKQILQAERLSPVRAATLAAGVAEALHFAHRKGIYHRDIKPANILIGAEGRPQVGDFGLALSETQRWQHRHEIAGTLAYMAPEQICGDAHVLDGRTDVYGLGVVLFHALTGRLPFTGALENLREEILKRPAPALRLIDERIPAELERICLKCLAKNAGDRYATAQDLADDLRRFLRTAEPARPWFHRKPLVASLLVAAALAGLAASPSVTAWLSGGSNGAVVRGGIGDLASTVTDQGQRSGPSNEGTPEPPPPIPPVNPADPFGWSERLGMAPKELFFPGRRGTGKALFRSDPDAYEITSTNIRLVQLGQLGSGHHLISITIRQPVWVGSAGIFLGYRVIERDGRASARMQAFKILRPSGTEVATRLHIERKLDVVYPDSGYSAPEQELGYDVVDTPPVNGDVRLELEISPLGLKSIRWGGDKLENLTADGHNARLTAADYEGAWGVINQYGTTLFEDPTVLTIAGERR